MKRGGALGCFPATDQVTPDTTLVMPTHIMYSPSTATASRLASAPRPLQAAKPGLVLVMYDRADYLPPKLEISRLDTVMQRLALLGGPATQPGQRSSSSPHKAGASTGGLPVPLTVPYGARGHHEVRVGTGRGAGARAPATGQLHHMCI